MKRILPILFLLITSAPLAFADGVSIDKDNCTITKDGKTFPLFGKVEIVQTGADLKVELVKVGADIKVEVVNVGAASCGKVEIVEVGADVKVEIVEVGADLKVEIVDSGSGIN